MLSIELLADTVSPAWWIAIIAVEALLLAGTWLAIPSRQIRLTILAVVVLLSADLLTLQITRELLDSDSRRSTLAVALLAVAVVSMLVAATPPSPHHLAAASGDRRQPPAQLTIIQPHT